ncbi:MAG: nucleotide-binding protein [Spirochaetaceae bacterium]|nr:nucleotide-binding protein [Spirochaetaceae bacterium]
MTIDSAIEQINEAILDLQASDHDTYGRPLQRLESVLESEDLKPITDAMKSRVDFDAFLADANRGDEGTGGRAGLNWPDDRTEELGLMLVLIERGAKDPRWFLNVACNYYHGGRKYIESIRKITRSAIIPFGRDFARHLRQNRSSMPPSRDEPSDLGRVFVVHGHDEAPREMVARQISDLGLEPVILHEQPNQGMTVIEKLEANGNVGYAVIVLTPDDIGRGKLESEEKPRARQNVILELGYFLARLGRKKVIAFSKDEVEIPSDYMGVVYVPFDDAGGWRIRLGKELQNAGYDIDWNRIMR